LLNSVYVLALEQIQAIRLNASRIEAYAVNLKSGSELDELASRSSGFRSRIMPLRFAKIPARCHPFRQRLTVNWVTFAPSARSLFMTFICMPSRVGWPMALARLINKCATRPRASSELSETQAAINHAMFSVTAIEKALSSSAG